MPFITIYDKSYYFRIAGNETAKPLLLLHGSGGDGSVWGYQIRGLKDVCRIIIPDLPGHGRSDKIPHAQISVESYAEWLYTFIKALQLKNIVLAGHSLGGAVVQQYAHDHPEKLSAIVLIGTGLRFEFAGQYVNLILNDFNKAVEISCAQAYFSKIPADLWEKGFSMLTRNGQTALHNDMFACSKFDSSKWIDQIICPTYIICGQEDRITPITLSKELAERLKTCKLITIPQSGHMVMAESHKRFNSEIEKIIRSY